MHVLSKSFGLLAGGLAAACFSAAPADAATWTVGTWHQYSGNNNYYSVQAIQGDTNGWLIARDQAAALTGPTGGSVTLASITSADLDQFVFAGIDDPAFWSLDVAGNNEGPNLGGYQTDRNAEPAGDWAWVNGDTWSYTQWSPGEPSNQGGIEDYLTLFAAGNNRTGNWNDISNGTSPVGTQGSVHYYIAESAGQAGGVPEPATWALMLGGFGLIGAAMRRRGRPAFATV